MWNLFKKLFSLLVILWIVALILNLKVGGRSARDWTWQLWEQPKVQNAYRVVKDRVLALVHRDISVEQVFQRDLPTEVETRPAPSQIIDLDKIDPQDRKAIEKILEKSHPSNSK